MSHISVFDDQNPKAVLQQSGSHAEIAGILKSIGVRFEQWSASEAVQAGDTQEKVLAAYKKDIDRLIREEGYQTVDVVSLTPEHTEKAVFRAKFLSEHAHGEDEVRFFVDGEGLFALHAGNRVYEVLCQKGDLISVPANTTHWFDMGPNPRFVAIRLFNNPAGWVANYTGSDIAERFSRLENQA